MFIGYMNGFVKFSWFSVFRFVINFWDMVFCFLLSYLDFLFGLYVSDSWLLLVSGMLLVVVFEVLVERFGLLGFEGNKNIKNLREKMWIFF